MSFDCLRAYLDELIGRGIPAFACLVHQNYQPIFRHMGGFSDTEGRIPVSERDRYWLYSATKIFTVTAAMQLVEQGRLALDDPLGRYLPEFGAMRVKTASGETVAAEKRIRIRDLFCMTGGFSYDLHSPCLQAARTANPLAGTRELIRALAGDPLEFEPSTTFKYSLCHDVLAAVIEEVSGMRYGAYLEKNLFAPLGIEEMGFVPDEERLGRLSAQYRFDRAAGRAVPVPNTCIYRLSENYESGGAGLIGRAGEYIKLLDALANGGVGAEGARILSAESIARMRQNELSPVGLEAFHKQLHKTGYGYGLGVRTMMDCEASGTKGPIGEFGWGGAAGAYAMVDPFRGISVFYVQHVLSSGFVPLEIQPGIRDRVYAALAQD